MKLIKKKMLYMAVIALAGAGMLAMGIVQGNAQMSGVGSGMLAVAILKLFQYFRIMKDPEKVRQLEVVQNEERLVFLANKSAAVTLYVLIIIAYIAMLALMFMGNTALSSGIAYCICAALVIYLIVHAILNRKY